MLLLLLLCVAFDEYVSSLFPIQVFRVSGYFIEVQARLFEMKHLYFKDFETIYFYLYNLYVILQYSKSFSRTAQRSERVKSVQLESTSTILQKWKIQASQIISWRNRGLNWDGVTNVVSIESYGFLSAYRIKQIEQALDYCIRGYKQQQ